MKKFYSLFVFIALLTLPFMGAAQEMMTNGDLEAWDDANNPTGWDKAESISQESTIIHGGTYSAAHTSGSSTQDFQQVIDGVMGGQQYIITYYFMDNDASAKSRIWSYWLDMDGNTLSENADVLRPDTYSTDSSAWQQFSATLTAPSAATAFRFEVRVYSQDGQSGGNVYYDDFSFVADQTVYPEPTNYPTDFLATASGVTINLTWTDAVGDQLPSAYLILGEKVITGNAAFDVPQDGTPVPDDLDWSDGSVAVNVPYGAQAYEFMGLETGTTYDFVIYPYTNSGDNIDYKTDGTAPTASATTDNIIILNEEHFDSGLGTWTPYNVLGDQVWEQSEYGGQTFAKMSGYDGQPFDNEDWLISPQMDWSGFTELYFKFISAMNYTGPALQLYYSHDYDGAGNPNDFTWTEITDQYSWSDGGWNWVESGDGDLLPYANPVAYLAFKFTSTTDGSATWELDDLMVYGKKTSGIGDHQNAVVGVYPNPAKGFVNVSLEQQAQIQLVNLNGQVVSQQSLAAGVHRLETTQLTRGIYVLRVSYADGSSVNKKLIIE